MFLPAESVTEYPKISFSTPSHCTKSTRSFRSVDSSQTLYFLIVTPPPPPPFFHIILTFFFQIVPLPLSLSEWTVPAIRHRRRWRARRGSGGLKMRISLPWDGVIPATPITALPPSKSSPSTVNPPLSLPPPWCSFSPSIFALNFNLYFANFTAVTGFARV